MPLSTERKAEYFVRMKELMTAYPKLFVVEINNVGSKQIQETRIALRGTAEILMGKNTMMRKCIREYAEENPDTPLAQTSVKLLLSVKSSSVRGLSPESIVAPSISRLKKQTVTRCPSPPNARPSTSSE